MEYEDNFTAFLFAAQMEQRRRPEWRWGQTLFNVLHEMRPDLSMAVAATDLDPFYDQHIDQFLTWAEANWNDDFGG